MDHHLVLKLSALLLFCFSSLPSVSAQADAVDDYIKTEMQKRRIPGLALAVVRNGEVIKLQGYGLASLELAVPVTPDTVFELASVTKQFTATAVMLLVDEGKLKLEDPVTQHLPGAPEAWKGITVRHLLTHTAGLASLETGFRALWEGGVRLDYSTAQAFDAAIKDPISFAPGEKWQYSDVGYFLLGMIIEKVTGQRYREFLTDRFFRPLGMTATSVPSKWELIRNRAPGYTFLISHGPLVHIRRDTQFNLPSHYGVFSTVKDLVKWEAALVSGKVVKQSTLDLMWSPVGLNDGSSYPYGFGWQVKDIRSHREISHTGITGTDYARFPNDKITVIVLTNLGALGSHGPVNSWGLARGVAGRYLSELLLSSLKQQLDPDPQRTQKIRDSLSNLTSDEETSLLTPGLRASLTPDERNRLAAQLRELRSFTYLSCDEQQGQTSRHGGQISRICYYKVIAGQETYYYTVFLTSDRHIADFTSSLE